MAELFTLEQLYSYHNAILNALEEVSKLLKEGYDGIIVPSRGAVPIAVNLLNYLGYLSERSPELYVPKKLVAPYQLKRLTKNRNVGVHGSVRDSHSDYIPIILLPLTADIRIEEKILREYGFGTQEEVVDSIRKWGAHLIYSLTTEPGSEERRLFTTLSKVHEVIEGRKNVAKYYRLLGAHVKVEKPIIVDTVISGRASSTILGELDTLYDDYVAVLFVDHNGTKLRKPYSSKLQQLENEGKVIRFPVKRLFTEDKGASLLGTIGVFYPRISLSLLRDRGEAAITWHLVSEYTKRNPVSKVIEPYKKAFQQLIDLFYFVLRSTYEEKIPDERVQEIYRNTIGVFEELNVPRIEEFIPPTLTIRKRDRSNSHIEDIYETSSHVVHVVFKRERARKLVKSITGKP